MVSVVVSSPQREVTTQLYRQWLEQEPAAHAAQAPEQWLEEWLGLADELMKDAPPGPTARELLEEDRNRLERR